MIKRLPFVLLVVLIILAPLNLALAHQDEPGLLKEFAKKSK